MCRILYVLVAKRTDETMLHYMIAAIVVRLVVFWSVLSVWVSWFGDFPPVPAIHWLNATQMLGTRSARPQCAWFLLDIASWSIPQACYVAESNWRTHFWMGFGATLLFVSTGNCWEDYRSKLPKVPLLVFSAATSAIDNYLLLVFIISKFIYSPVKLT